MKKMVWLLLVFYLSFTCSSSLEHSGDEIFIYVNGGLISLQGAVDLGVFNSNSYIGGTSVGVYDFGHSGYGVGVVVDGVEKSFQEAINDGSLCGYDGGVGVSSGALVGHVGDEVGVVVDGVERTLQGLVDEGFFAGVWDIDEGEVYEGVSFVKSRCGIEVESIGTMPYPNEECDVNVGIDCEDPGVVSCRLDIYSLDGELLESYSEEKYAVSYGGDTGRSFSEACDSVDYIDDNDNFRDYSFLSIFLYATPGIIQCDGSCEAVSDSSGLECEDKTWSPSVDSICKGTEVIQESDCGNFRVVDGEACCNSEWSPSVDEFCDGVSFEQENLCGEVRWNVGIKTDGDCCNIEIWSPSVDEFCDGVSFEQMSNCDSTRTNVGVKTIDECCVSNVWEPSAEEVCRGEVFEQENECGEVRDMVGEKEYDIKIVASDGAAKDIFGCSVDIDGDYLAVGAYADDDMGENSGSVYLFERSECGWIEMDKVVASDGAAGDMFGWLGEVSLGGNYLAVGAYADDDMGENSGSVYLFERNGDEWVEMDKVVASDGEVKDYFGSRVSLNGDYLAVGAYNDDDMGESSGSVYLFERNGDEWVEMDKVVASDGAAGDYFGFSLSFSGDYLAVGAYADDDMGENSGSVYLFERNGDEWVEMDKVVASDGRSGGAYFGHSVSLDGSNLAVGARLSEDSRERVYLFERSGDNWIEVDNVVASGGEAHDWFGYYSLSLSGDYLVTGAYGDDDKGSAYLFEKNGGEWVEVDKIVVDDRSRDDYFGYRVSIDGNYLVATVPGDDDMGVNSGSAYVFPLGGYLL